MAEATLWNELKAKRLGGYKFVRQMPIGPYFADFACRSGNLVVELDGSQHAESDYDRRRDEFMRCEGYSVMRFWGHDVLKNLTGACETLLAALDGRLAEDVVAFDLRFVFAPRKIGETGGRRGTAAAAQNLGSSPPLAGERCRAKRGGEGEFGTP